MQQESRLRKRRSQEGPRNVRKYRQSRKSNENFSCELKTPVTNIAKIAKITNVAKFYIDVEKGETKKGPEMSGNIAQVTRIFLAS